MKSFKLMAITGLVSSLALSNAWADDVNANKEKDLVIVTGHKEKSPETNAGALGNKTVLDTPFSLSVINSQDIERRGATSLGQIFINDPGVTNLEASATTGWWGIQIRGIGVRKHYIDNAEMSLYWGGEFPTEPIEQITALKGLSGFMYGFASPGGIISYETKKPKTVNSTSITYRNPTLFELHQDYGGKIGNLGFRFNGVVENGEAYNTSKTERGLASLALNYDFTDNFSWFSSFIYEDKNLKEEPLQIYITNSSAMPKATYDYDNITIDDSYYRTKTLFANTGFKYKFNDDWNVSISYALTQKKHESNKAFAYLLNKEGDYSGYVYQFYNTLKSQYGQALLNGKLATGSIRHDIVFGASLQKDYDDWADSVWDNGFNGNIYENQTYIMPKIPAFAKGKSNLTINQKSVFLSDTIHFNEKWQTIIGVRYSDYKNEQSGYETQPVSPSFALIYKPIKNISIYASYVEGLEEGAKVTEEYANAGEYLDATTSTQTEVGVKYESNQLNVTAAIFNLDRAAQIGELRDGLVYLTQNGLTLYRGLEFNTQYKVNEAFKIGAGFIYNDAQFDKMSASNKSWEGKIPWGVNKWQYVANVEYAFPKVEGLKFHANYRYYGKVRAGLDYGVTEWGDFSSMFLEPHQIVNAGFEYKTTQYNRPITYNLNFNNIFNEKYWAHNGIGEAANMSFSAKLDW